MENIFEKSNCKASIWYKFDHDIKVWLKMYLPNRLTKGNIYFNKQEYCLSQQTLSLDFDYKYNSCEHSSNISWFSPINLKLECCCQFRNIPNLLIEQVWSIYDLCRRVLNPDLHKSLSVRIKMILTRYVVLIKSQCLYITLFDMCIQIDKFKFFTEEYAFTCGHCTDVKTDVTGIGQIVVYGFPCVCLYNLYACALCVCHV